MSKYPKVSPEELRAFLFSKTQVQKSFNVPDQLKIKRLRPFTPDLPTYATKGSAGLDLRADFSDYNAIKFMFNSGVARTGTDPNDVSVEIGPGGRVLIPTGLSIELPAGFEAQVRSRSGLALKNGIAVLNSPGTVDADYRGEVGVILVNHSNVAFHVSHGDRIAQLVVARVEQLPVVEVGDLSTSERGVGGFGSTGVK